MDLVDGTGRRIGAGLYLADGFALAATACRPGSRVVPVAVPGPAMPVRVVATLADVVVVRLDGDLPPAVRGAPLVRWAGRRLPARVPDRDGYLCGVLGGGVAGHGRLVVGADSPPGCGMTGAAAGADPPGPVRHDITGAAVATADPAGSVVGVVVGRLGADLDVLPVEAVEAAWPALTALLARPPAPAGPGAGALTLLPSFAAVPALLDPGTRQSIVSALRPDISRTADRHPQANFDILGILRACLRFPGGLTELVDVIRVFEQGSSEMADLDRAVAAIPPGTVR